METNSNYTTAALMNLSTLTQYFIPFGNFIFPIVIWSSKKETSEYINKQGKETINFQLSLFLYSLVLAAIAIPIFLITLFRNIDFNAVINDDDFIVNHFNYENISTLVIIGVIAAVVFFSLKIAEFFLIIYAALKTSNGEDFKYPLTISFIK